MGISFDSPADNAAFRDKFSFPFDLLSDLDGSTSIAFGVSEVGSLKAPRKSVLIGPDGKIHFAYDEVKAADHPEQVINDLDSIS